MTTDGKKKIISEGNELNNTPRKAGNVLWSQVCYVQLCFLILSYFAVTIYKIREKCSVYDAAVVNDEDAGDEDEVQ